MSQRSLYRFQLWFEVTDAKALIARAVEEYVDNGTFPDEATARDAISDIETAARYLLDPGLTFEGISVIDTECDETNPF